MKFCWVTINVKDMEKSMEFYKEVLGLPINRRFNTGTGVEIAFLGDEFTKVELIYNEKCKEIAFGQDISIGFEVESLDDMVADLKNKGITIHSGPYQPNPKMKFLFIQDPDGLKIQLVQNL